MPGYITSPQVSQVKAIYSGNSIALVTPADTGVTKTLQVAIGPEPGGTPQVSLINTTTQTAAVQFAASDADANYAPLSENGAAIIVAASTTVSFPVSVGWIRCTFGTAPTSGSLVISR